MITQGPVVIITRLVFTETSVDAIRNVVTFQKVQSSCAARTSNIARSPLNKDTRSSY